MPYVKVGQENSGDIELYYEDHGAGQPVVLIHGFPLSGASWEKQLPVLLDAGHRVITYDRRGFGRSSQPTSGYDYDTFAADLEALLTKLDLRDIVLVGFSMGTGEVARYLGRYGSDRVAKAAFLGSIPPFLLQTDDNPEGVPAEVFTGIEDGIKADRPSSQTAFMKDFFNVDVLGGDRITDDAVHAHWNIAMDASPVATLAVVASWLEDFRLDIAKVDVPALVMHGTADRILPYASAGPRLKDLLQDVTFIAVQDGPHAINWTHAEEVNAGLLDFMKA